MLSNAVYNPLEMFSWTNSGINILTLDEFLYQYIQKLP